MRGATQLSEEIVGNDDVHSTKTRGCPDSRAWHTSPSTQLLCAVSSRCSFVYECGTDGCMCAGGCKSRLQNACECSCEGVCMRCAGQHKLPCERPAPCYLTI